MTRGSKPTRAPNSAMPYRRSWADALVGLIERIPGPAWLFYAPVIVAFIVAGTLVRWSVGVMPMGTLSATMLVLDLLPVFGLVAFHRAKLVARHSLSIFRPALGELESRFGVLEYELTTLSRRAGVVAVIAAAAFTTASLVDGPEAWGITATTPPVAAAFLIGEAYVMMSFYVLFIFFAYRQVTLVARIHRRATRISLFEAASRNAFSTLTLNLSILVALPVYLSAISYAVVGEFFTDVSIFDIGLIVVVLLTASLIFVIPLYGLHRRLLREKADALMAVGASFGLTTRELHDQIASKGFDQLGGVSTALSGLTAERDALKRASTWPWEAETFRGFLSSIALPIVLWLVTNLLGRLLGT